MIRDYIGNLSPRVDVLCLQEHKLRGYKAERNIRTLWENENLWSLKASPSNEAEDRKMGWGKEALPFLPTLYNL